MVRPIRTGLGQPKDNDYGHLECLLDCHENIEFEKASVVIPFLNDINILQRTLASLVMQTVPKEYFEIILVKVKRTDRPEYFQCSNQRLKACVGSFRDSFRSIRIVEHERNGFCGASARNLGILTAKHPIIISLDFDMIVPPIFLAEHLKWFNLDADLATIGPRRFVQAAGLTVQDIQTDFAKVIQLLAVHSISNTSPTQVHDKRLVEFRFFMSHPYPFNCFHGCNVAYRKSSAIKVRLWNEEFDGNFGYEDIEFGYRLWRQGHYLIYNRTALGYHQENTVVSQKEKQKGYQVNRAKLYTLIPSLAPFREIELPKLRERIAAPLRFRPD